MDDNKLIPGQGADPIEPVAPEISAEDAQEDAEWDKALEEYAPGLKKVTTEETTSDEQTDPETTTTTTTEAPKEVTTTTTTIDPNETPEQKTERERVEAEKVANGDGEEPGSEEEDDFEQSSRTARQTARDAAREVETVATDVREKMFADAPKVLQDKDGDPIRSIQDVMNLVNPNTGEGFTETEAATWLLAAQQQFNQNLAAQDKEINQIAETLVDLKDQADSINYQFGPLLKAMPDLQQKLWAQYEKTLVKDPTTNIITKAPVSMEDFYNTALEPYVRLAESLEAQNDAQAVADKAKADAQKIKTRSDRADIFGRGDVDEGDDEDKEWDTATKAFLSNR